MARTPACRRRELVADIEKQGIVMASSCLRCSQSNRPCVKSDKSSKCSECVRVGRRCVSESFVPRPEWNKLYRAQQKLEEDEKRALEEQIRISSQLLRLQKQKRFLKDRAGKFLQSDVESLEELEKLEEEEQRQRDALAREQQQSDALLATLNGSSSDNLPLNWTDLLDNLDSGGEIPSTSSSRSQDVS